MSGSLTSKTAYSALKCRTYEEAVAQYGPVDLQTLRWPGEAQWMAIYEVPRTLASSWVNTVTGRGMLTQRIYCHRDLVEPLGLALANILDASLEDELKTFDGCFDIRSVRGRPDLVSTHAYGLAIDVNAAENPAGASPRLSAGFVACWTDAGFDWGGYFERREGMHFSFAWEGNLR